MNLRQLTTKLALVLAAITIVPAYAIPIQFIYTGIGSGNIGQTAFTNAAFTFTQNADTSNIQGGGCPGFCSLDADSATVTIAGVGTFNFITGTRTFNNSGSVGFSRAGLSGLDLYNVFSVGPTYDLMSSIGPIGGTATLLQWGSSPVDTTGGVLSFVSDDSRGTFEAIAGNSVPEPATLALFGLGLIGLGALRRKK